MFSKFPKFSTSPNLFKILTFLKFPDFLNFSQNLHKLFKAGKIGDLVYGMCDSNWTWKLAI